MRLALVLVVLAGCDSEIQGSWTDRADFTLKIDACEGRICSGSVSFTPGATDPGCAYRVGAEQQSLDANAYKVWLETQGQEQCAFGGFAAVCVMSDDAQEMNCSCGGSLRLSDFCPSKLFRVGGS